jgi:phosphoglycerol transferase MdoB-like AlkP superfamily enzyme
VTPANIALVVATFVAAATLQHLPRRLSPAASRWPFAIALVLAVLAPFARSRVDTHGRDRNVVVAFVASAVPHVHPRREISDWRASPWASPEPEPLSSLHGAARGRNVVIVSLESTAAQYLPAYGGSEDVAPTFAELARDSLLFDQAYAAYPESIKGLFSVLCSTFPAFDVAPQQLSRATCDALPSRLRAAGYTTALFHSGRFDYLGMNAVIANRGFDILEDAGDIGGNHQSSFGVDEPSTVDRMLAWIDRVPRDRPFLLTYLPIAGHHPYEAPSSTTFSNADDFGRYRNAVRYGDASLATLVRGIRARGLDRHTIWILFGDHGEAFGQHPGNYGHTFFVYDENVHVPFVIAAPGLTPGERHVARTVSLVDVAPTVLDLLGLDAPAIYQGRSALDGPKRMALFFTDYSVPLAGLVDGAWKAIYEVDTGRVQLFDRRRDRSEREDVSDQHADRARWYGDRLKRWSAAQKYYVLQAAVTPAAP